MTGHLFGLGGGSGGGEKRGRRDIMGFTLFRRGGGHCSTVRNPAWELPPDDVAPPPPPLFVQQGVSAEFDPEDIGPFPGHIRPTKAGCFSRSFLALLTQNVDDLLLNEYHTYIPLSY